jgi:hypothetical protein
MNRKQFLRRSALLSLAAAGLPKIVHAFREQKKSDSWYVSEPIRRSETSYLQYSVRMDDKEVTEGFITPIRIKLVIVDNTSQYGTSGPKGTYTLERAGDPKMEGSNYIVNFKRYGEVEGTDVLHGKFPKKVSMTVDKGTQLLLHLSKSEFITLKYYVPDNDDAEECFLTTACTQARGLADDCAELTTLRSLRNDFMLPSVSGTALVSEYYRIAPEIVRRVNERSNYKDIWNTVYTDLVQHSVALIHAGKNEEAVAHYAEYVIWMKEAFL